MLRITTDDTSQARTFRLEERLEGPCVTLLMQFWRTELTRSGGRRLSVDLNGVTFIAAEAKPCLAEIHKEGADFIADDVMNKAIVAEIVVR
jgi:hypothetical protein